MPHHPHTPNPREARSADIRRVTLVGAGVNLLLALGKMLLGWLGQSQALFADGVHSLSDLVTDAMVLFAAKHGSQEADEEHPYGHGRIETLGALFMGLFLLAVALGLAMDAGRRLFEPEGLWHPTLLALVAVVFSILAKEWLFHYTLRVANQLHSQLLYGNAWHHRTDSLSSIIVLVGIGGSWWGMPWLDAVGAIGVTAMIAYIGWELMWQGMRDLIDTGLDERELAPIRELIAAQEGVDEVHDLRTRRMGSAVVMDVHVVVPPRVSVSEGHQIGEDMRLRLHRQHPEITDMIVHVDPENDEVHGLNAHLPKRAELTRLLQTAWADVVPPDHAEHLIIHYLRGKIAVEAVLPLPPTPEAARSLRDTLRQRAFGTLPDLAQLDVFFAP